jgi:hypothetical protein
LENTSNRGITSPLTQPNHKPSCILLISQLIGKTSSGKSTQAALLSAKLGCTVLLYPATSGLVQ